MIMTATMVIFAAGPTLRYHASHDYKQGEAASAEDCVGNMWASVNSILGSDSWQTRASAKLQRPPLASTKPHSPGQVASASKRPTAAPPKQEFLDPELDNPQRLAETSSRPCFEAFCEHHGRVLLKCGPEAMSTQAR